MENYGITVGCRTVIQATICSSLWPFLPLIQESFTEYLLCPRHCATVAYGQIKEKGTKHGTCTPRSLQFLEEIQRRIQWNAVQDLLC